MITWPNTLKFVNQGYSAADIKSLTKEVFMTGLREVIGENYENLSGSKDFNVKSLVLKEKQFMDSISRVRPSPCIENSVYLNWSSRFGSQ